MYSEHIQANNMYIKDGVDSVEKRFSVFVNCTYPDFAQNIFQPKQNLHRPPPISHLNDECGTKTVGSPATPVTKINQNDSCSNGRIAPARRKRYISKEDQIPKAKRIRSSSPPDAKEDAETEADHCNQWADSLSLENSYRENYGNPGSKAYVHVRARRGEATDGHSLAERARRGRIRERMRYLRDLVPGCSNKVTGKAVMLDEIINYVQSLQKQIEFLSMRLAAMDLWCNFGLQIENILPQRAQVPASVCPTHHTMASLQASAINNIGWPSAYAELQTCAADNYLTPFSGAFEDGFSQQGIRQWDVEVHPFLQGGLSYAGPADWRRGERQIED
eukprot:Gb_36369 [translate_table: standard]